MRNGNRDNENLQPPQSLDAEQAVLGSILKDPEALDVAMAAVKCDDFYYPKHQEIFGAATDLSAKSEPCDLTTVANRLLDKGALGRIGGRVYLVQLAESVATTSHLEAYAKIVADKSNRRRLMGKCREIVELAYGDTDTDELLASAEGGIMELSKRTAPRKVLPICDTLQETLEVVERRQAGEVDPSAIKTGFNDYDHMVGYLRGGDLLIIGGYVSQGKTQVAIQAAQNNALDFGKASGVFSIEMTRQLLELRLLCSQAGVEWEKVERGTLTDGEWLLLTTAAATLSKGARIYIDDTPSLTPRQLLVESRRLVDKHEVGLIIVDYLQLMGADGKHESQNVFYEELSQQLLSTSKQLNVPLIVLSQLTKNTTNTPLIKMGGQQRLNLLRGSGGIAQAASRVMFVYHDNQQSAWLVDKTRTGTGKTGVIPMAFQRGCWADLSKREEH